MYLQYLAKLLSNETSQSARPGSPSSNQGQPHQNTIGPNNLWNRLWIVMLIQFYKTYLFLKFQLWMPALNAYITRFDKIAREIVEKK